MCIPRWKFMCTFLCTTLCAFVPNGHKIGGRAHKGCFENKGLISKGEVTNLAKIYKSFFRSILSGEVRGEVRKTVTSLTSPIKQELCQFQDKSACVFKQRKQRAYINFSQRKIRTYERFNFSENVIGTYCKRIYMMATGTVTPYI